MSRVTDEQLADLQKPIELKAHEDHETDHVNKVTVWEDGLVTMVLSESQMAALRRFETVRIGLSIKAREE